MNSVVHFEIAADDTDRAKKFYGDIFGWNFNQMGGDYGDYIMCMTTETDQQKMMPKNPGAINGGMMKKNPNVKNTIITISVDDMDATLEKVKAQGGKVLNEKNMIPKVGWYAQIEDTEGNVVSLLQPVME